MTNEPVYIVDIFRDIVTKVSESLTEQLQAVHSQITGVHYLVGHHTENNDRLTAMTGAVSRYNKYPLIALFQDFKEKDGDGTPYLKANLTLIIVYHTEKKYYTEDRYDKVFKPILYPIYHEFLKQVFASPETQIKSWDTFSKEKTDRPNWGSPEKYGNDGNIFPDTLDGIEITFPNLQFKQRKARCTPSLKTQ